MPRPGIGSGLHGMCVCVHVYISICKCEFVRGEGVRWDQIVCIYHTLSTNHTVPPHTLSLHQAHYTSLTLSTNHTIPPSHPPPSPMQTCYQEAVEKKAYHWKISQSLKTVRILNGLEHKVWQYGRMGVWENGECDMG